MLLVRRLSLYLCREWLTLLLAALAALLAVDFAFAPLGLRDLLALRAERTRLESVHLRLLKSNAALKIKVRRLRGDDHYLERLIREQLGYVRPGDLVYRFADHATAEQR
jgi:cell division protein FtsB